VNSTLFLIIIVAFAALLAGVAGYWIHRARKSSQGNWESIVKRLTFIDRNSVEEIALDIIDPSGQPRHDENSALLEASESWDRIGGWKGIEALESNCAVLIDLAFYVQQWYPEAIAVTEQLRLSAREIESHISKLRIARKTGKLETIIPMYGQRAIATYYLMTRRVLTLYEQGNLSMLTELQRAL
jgi:hypothetical protein